MTIRRWAVIASGGALIGWGPFDDPAEAQRFAQWARAETGSGGLLPLVLPLRSPAAEMLLQYVSREHPGAVAVAHLRPRTDAPPMLGDLIADMAADLAGCTAYVAWQQARGVPTGSIPDGLWRLLPEASRAAWRAAALAVLDARGEVVDAEVVNTPQPGECQATMAGLTCGLLPGHEVQDHWDPRGIHWRTAQGDSWPLLGGPPP